MKKTAVFGIVACLAVLSFVSCSPKAGAPKAGASDLDAMLNLVPKNVQGVILVDVHRVMTTDLAEKAIKEDKNYAKYQDFIKDTGIDPQKDVYFLAAGIAEKSEASKGEGAAVICLKYSKDPLLAKMKKEKPDIKEETYNGVTIYSAPQPEPGKSVSGAFLDNSNIVFGSDSMVRSIIDVFQKKADSVSKNENLAAIMKTANKKAMIWSAFAIPPDAAKNLSAQNPMLGALEGLRAVTLDFDYRDKSYNVQIRTAGGDEPKNKQLADMLTGLKAMGAGASAKNPDVGVLLNKIEISSGPDFLRMYASLPEDLIQRLTKSAAQKVEGMMQPKAEAKTEGSE